METRCLEAGRWTKSWLLSSSKGPRGCCCNRKVLRRAQTSLSLADGRLQPTDILPKENKATGFLATTLYVAIFPYCTAAKKRVGTAKKKKTATVFFFSKIFFWPESLIASPAQVKLVGAVRFQSAPIGFYDGREDTKKKVKCYLTRPMHRSYCTVCLLLAIFIFLARISPAKKN